MMAKNASWARCKLPRRNWACRRKGSRRTRGKPGRSRKYRVRMSLAKKSLFEKFAMSMMDVVDATAPKASHLDEKSSLRPSPVARASSFSDVMVAFARPASDRIFFAAVVMVCIDDASFNFASTEPPPKRPDTAALARAGVKAVVASTSRGSRPLSNSRRFSSAEKNTSPSTDCTISPASRASDATNSSSSPPNASANFNDTTRRRSASILGCRRSMRCARSASQGLSLLDLESRAAVSSILRRRSLSNDLEKNGDGVSRV
mmetsp:Transcript_24586/g.79463  ORF Transcript_24586/g.79463 Transcript_24586/m.79463 type:complete len:261 (-) Transcript_24586:1191-1973(-)